MIYNTAIALALAGFAAAAASQSVVYVTDVVHATTTYCPAGQTITHASGTTVLTAPTIITSSWTEKSSMSHPAASSVSSVGSHSVSMPAYSAAVSSPSGMVSSSVPMVSSSEVAAGTATPIVPGTSAYYPKSSSVTGAVGGGSAAPTGHAHSSGVAGSNGTSSAMPSVYTGAASHNVAGLTGLAAVAGAFLALV